jgi:hypothetical protein
VAFSQSELPRLRTPPDIPLPDPRSDPDWYGQIWLRYPADPRLYTTHFPQQFHAQSGLCRAMVMACSYREQLSKGGGGGRDPPAPLHAVYDDYHRHLKPWYDGLPEPLRPGRIAFPSQLILQYVFSLPAKPTLVFDPNAIYSSMHYQNALIKLFEPFCPTPYPFPHPPPPPSEEETPSQIRDVAARHLETLLRLYYLRHGFEHLDIYISGYFLSQQGFMTLRKLNSLLTITTLSPESWAGVGGIVRDLRATLFLTAKGLADQGRSAYIPRALLWRLRAEMAPRERMEVVQLLGEDV